MEAELHPLRSALAPIAEIEEVWFVGGAVRTALTGGGTASEADLIIAGDAAACAKTLADAYSADRFRLSADFGSWRVSGGKLGITVDITPLQGADLREDLARRDFTVNAVAVPLAGGEPVDHHGGLRDAERGVLRLVSDDALRADPVRLLRLVRLETALGMGVDDAALTAARAAAPLVAEGTPERMMDEFRTLLRSPRPARSIARLDEMGALGALIPPLDEARGMEQNPYHHKDVLGHVLEVVERTEEIVADPEPVFRSLAPEIDQILGEELANGLTRGQALVFAALFHDIAKPATQAVSSDGRVTFMGHDRLGAEMADDWCRRWKTSSRLREFIAGCVADHLVLGFMVHRGPLSLRQVHRYRRRIAPREVELAVLSVADRLATRGPRTRESAVTRHLALAREVMAAHFRLERAGPAAPAIAGDELARRLERAPGPWLAEALDAILEEQVVGRVRSPETAVAFAREWIAARPAEPSG